ncbi:MAG: TSUP family transporter, partial [Halobacteriaceae archaeon]
IILFVILGYVIIRPENSVTLKQHTVHNKCHPDKQDCYDPPGSLSLIMASSILGGLFAGLVSTGIGEMNDFILLEEYDMHGPITAGTSVFVVAITVLVGIVTHAYGFVSYHLNRLPQVVNIVMFAIPGVLLGAELGVNLSEYISEYYRNYFIGILFFLLAIVTTLSVVA